MAPSKNRPGQAVSPSAWDIRVQIYVPPFPNPSEPWVHTCTIGVSRLTPGSGGDKFVVWWKGGPQYMVAEGFNEVPRHPLGGRYGTPGSRWCQGDRQQPPGVGWVTDVDASLWRPYNHTAAEPELNLFKKTGAASVYSSVLGPRHSCLHTAGTQGLSGNDCPHFTDKETEAERG